MSRLILFTFFLLLVVGVVSLTGFRKNYDINKDFTTFIKSESTNKDGETEAAPKIDPNVAHMDSLKEKFPEAYKLYTETAQCIKCHGTFGQGVESEEGPLIAGQFDWYITDQIAQMQAGSRVNEKMLPYIKDLSSADIATLATFIQEMRIK